MKDCNTYLNWFCLIYLLLVPLSIYAACNAHDLGGLFFICMIPIIIAFSAIIFVISSLGNNKSTNRGYLILMIIIQALLLVSGLYHNMKNVIPVLIALIVSSVLSKTIVNYLKTRDSIISFWGLNFNLFIVLFPIVAGILETFYWFRSN
ncbi:hypothetical protein AGMMS49982_02930 [Bacteroidia bacterium]|nr:hypothetical protein AGMMS49982_02930 [Bacteroidia bacterium]